MTDSPCGVVYRFRVSFTPPEPQGWALWPHLSALQASAEQVRAERVAFAREGAGPQITLDDGCVLERDRVVLIGTITIPPGTARGALHASAAHALIEWLIGWVLSGVYQAGVAADGARCARQPLPLYRQTLTLVPRAGS